MYSEEGRNEIEFSAIYRCFIKAIFATTHGRGGDPFARRLFVSPASEFDVDNTRQRRGRRNGAILNVAA